MAQATTITRRDRKRQATRDAIVEAALDLFEEKGFAATTVDEITERADMIHGCELADHAAPLPCRKVRVGGRPDQGIAKQRHITVTVFHNNLLGSWA